MHIFSGPNCVFLRKHAQKGYIVEVWDGSYGVVHASIMVGEDKAGTGGFHDALIMVCFQCWNFEPAQLFTGFEIEKWQSSNRVL